MKSVSYDKRGKEIVIERCE